MIQTTLELFHNKYIHVNMALMITDCNKINKKSRNQATSCGQKCNFCWKNLWLSEPYLMWEKLQHSSDDPSIKYFSAILLLAHSFYFLSNTWKYYFLIDHYYETQTESSDSVAFVRILWCSRRVYSCITHLIRINRYFKKSILLWKGENDWFALEH